MERERQNQRGKRWRVMAWCSLSCLTFAMVGCGGDQLPQTEAITDDTEFDYRYEIPAGTRDRLDAGEVVEIVPGVLEVKVGESIEIVNNDDADHTVGLFFVPAGAALRQTFTSPGELTGDCDVHPSGSFTVKVES